MNRVMRLAMTTAIILVSIGLCATAAGATAVPATVGSTTWTRAGSPYRIAQPCTVAAGARLDIEPGVDVLFDADVPLVVRGSLRAVGTAADSIRFLPGESERWRGVRIYPQNRDSSTLHYVHISGGHTSGADWRDPDSYGGTLCIGMWREIPSRDRTSMMPDPAALIVPPFPEDSARAGLAHLVVSGGHGPQGGGMAVQFASVTMSDCTIRGNTAAERGGGIYVNASRMTAQRCRFVGNSVEPRGDNGGGVRLWDSHVLLEDCEISGNTAPGWGGGLHAKLMPGLAMRRCVVRGNQATDGGGVAIGKQSIMMLEDCTIEGNTAQDEAGGFYAENHAPWDYPRRTHIDMTGCSISGNRAGRSGAAHLINCDVEMTLCRLTDNEAAGYCGGISADHAAATVRRCVIAGNRAGGRGGALFAAFEGYFRVENCVVTDNIAASYGLACAEARSSITLEGTIARGNSPAQSGGEGTLLTRWSNTDDETIAGGPGVIDADPLFSADGEHRLLPDSPCIDAGSPYLLDEDGTRSDMGLHGGTGGERPGPRVEVNAVPVVVPASGSPGAVPGAIAIGNAGSRPLTISGIAFPNGSGFSATGPFPVTVEPGEHANVSVTYSGDAERRATGTVRSNDPFQPETRVTVVGAVGTFVRDTVCGAWRKAGSPYRVIGPTVVPAGETLTIEPGVDVLFDAPASLTVEGSIVAHGTERDSVRFLPGHARWWEGIIIRGPSATMRYCRVSGVRSDGHGGGIWVAAPGNRTELTHCTISDNTSAGGGGGVSVEARMGPDSVPDTLLVTSCTIRGNRAEWNGGGMYVEQAGHMEVRDSRIERNESASPGGGAAVGFRASGRFVNTFFIGNTACELAAGLLYGQWESVTEVTNCTFAENILQSPAPTDWLAQQGAATAGTAAFGAMSTLTATNSIFWGTPRQDVGGIRQATTAFTFCNVQGDTVLSGEGNINTDPRYVEGYRTADDSPCRGAGANGADMGADQ